MPREKRVGTDWDYVAGDRTESLRRNPPKGRSSCELKSDIIKELKARRTQATCVLRFHSRTKTVSKLCTSPDMFSLLCPRLQCVALLSRKVVPGNSTFPIAIKPPPLAATNARTGGREGDIWRWGWLGIRPWTPLLLQLQGLIPTPPDWNHILQKFRGDLSYRTNIDQQERGDKFPSPHSYLLAIPV